MKIKDIFLLCFVILVLLLPVGFIYVFVQGTKMVIDQFSGIINPCAKKVEKKDKTYKNMSAVPRKFFLRVQKVIDKGDYLLLKYEIDGEANNDLPIEEGCLRASSHNCWTTTTDHCRVIPRNMQVGEKVDVRLYLKENNVAKVAYIEPYKTITYKGFIVVEGEIINSPYRNNDKENIVSVEYGIEKYYVDKNKKEQILEKLNKNKLVEVKLDENNKLKVTKILDYHLSWAKWPDMDPGVSLKTENNCTENYVHPVKIVPLDKEKYYEEILKNAYKEDVLPKEEESVKKIITKEEKAILRVNKIIDKGDYLLLKFDIDAEYDISAPAKECIDEYIIDSKKITTDWCRKIPMNYKKNEEINIHLKLNNNGIAEIDCVDVNKNMKDKGFVIKAKIKDSPYKKQNDKDVIYIEYGIEKYFVDKNKKQDIINKLNKNKLVEIKINENNEAKISKILDYYIPIIKEKSDIKSGRIIKIEKI